MLTPTYNKPKLSREELKLDIIVKASQLEEIYDTYITLTDVEDLPEGDYIGIIGFVGDELTEEAGELFKPGTCICPIYNEKALIDGQIYYEE